jgi:hypothetical protein
MGVIFKPGLKLTTSSIQVLITFGVSMKFPILFLLFFILTAVGCVKPEGNGIVGGRLFIEGCNETDNYGDKHSLAYFDLRANFFVGEPVKDESAVPTAHRLDIRLQKGSNTIEDTDSLYIQVSKVALTARNFVIYQPVSVGVDENVKASLALYLTCPSFFDGPEVNKTGISSCPSITASEQEEMCNSTIYGELDQMPIPHAPFALGDSCIVFCQFGDAMRGDTIGDDFSIDFGDEVSGIYFFTLNNRRIVYDNSEICADGIDNDNDGVIDEDICENITSGGFVQGNFKIKLLRAKAIQAFP